MLYMRSVESMLMTRGTIQYKIQDRFIIYPSCQLMDGVDTLFRLRTHSPTHNPHKQNHTFKK